MDVRFDLKDLKVKTGLRLDDFWRFESDLRENDAKFLGFLDFIWLWWSQIASDHVMMYQKVV